MFLNPNNGYVPKIGEIVRLVGACSPDLLDKYVRVTNVFDDKDGTWFRSKRWGGCRWAYYTNIIGGVEPVEDLRCCITNNSCGTDTTLKGSRCYCETCRLFNDDDSFDLFDDPPVTMEEYIHVMLMLALFVLFSMLWVIGLPFYILKRYVFRWLIESWYAITQ